MRFRNRLHPYRLPNARDAGIEASTRFEALLASGIDEILGGIPDAYGKLVVTLLDIVCDVKGEWILSTFMRHIRDFVVSYKHHRAEINGAEVQQYPLAWPRVALYGTGIPQKLVRIQKSSHS